MKFKILAGLGIGACAAACAAALFVPVLLGSSALGLGAWFASYGSSAEIVACLLVPLMLAVIAFLYFQRRRTIACAADKS